MRLCDEKTKFRGGRYVYFLFWVFLGKAAGGPGSAPRVISWWMLTVWWGSKNTRAHLWDGLLGRLRIEICELEGEWNLSTNNGDSSSDGTWAVLTVLALFSSSSKFRDYEPCLQSWSSGNRYLCHTLQDGGENFSSQWICPLQRSSRVESQSMNVSLHVLHCLANR